MTQKEPDRSELVEEVDGSTVYLLDDGQVRSLIHARDWGVRHPQTLKLMHDVVVVRPDVEEGVTKGGLHIPSKVQDDQFCRGDMIKSSNQHHTGTVVAVGPGRRDEDGDRMPVGVEVGDHVCYHRASGTGIVWTDGRMVVLVQGDGGVEKGDAIIGVVEG